MVKPARLLLVALLALIPGCFQAQLSGPVSGAQITIVPLNLASSQPTILQSSTPQDNIDRLGDETWQALGPLLRLWFLGTFNTAGTNLAPDRLYLVTASGGEDSDGDGDAQEDEQFTAVSGSWHAILTGSQLLESGYQVSPLTEAAYQWLAGSLASLSDAEILWNLGRAAQVLVEDVNDDQQVDYLDLAAWNTLLHRPKLQGDINALDDLTIALTNGADAEQIEAIAGTMLALDVESCPFACENIDTLPFAAQLWGQPLDEFFAISFRELMLREPETVVQLGLAERYGLEEVSLDNISDSFVLHTADMAATVLEGLNLFDAASLDAEQQLAVALYRYYLEDIVARSEYLLFSYPASSFITGAARQTEFFFSEIHPLFSTEDVDDFLARLQLVAMKIEQLRELVATRAEAGIIEPAITLDLGISALNAIANSDPTGTPYYRKFSNSLNGIDALDSANRLSLRFDARDIIAEQIQPAYQRLVDDLLELRPSAPLAIGFGQFDGGLDYYAYALRQHTTTDLSPEQIHQMGLTELTRVHREIREAAGALGIDPNTSLSGIFNSAAALGGTLRGADILAQYEALVAEAQDRLPQAFNEIPQQEVVVIGGPTGGFYVAGSEDGSRPGAFFAATIGNEPYFMMPSLAYHEAVPGHHLQLALAQEQSLPDFRRYVKYTGFTEGWALYAERLAYELGWYAGDPIGNLGRLQFEAIRAARLVLDTGIHALGWTWDEAVAAYQTHTGASLGSAQGNVARFMRWPGQATAYMVGMLRILELRNAQEQQLGDNFSLTDFHSQVLTGAAMPLDILAEQFQ